MEDELGAPLFVRQKPALKLTEEGTQFYTDAKHIIELALKAKQNVKFISNNKKKIINIGFLPVAEMKIFPYVMPLLRAQDSQLNIQFHSLSCLKQVQGLRDQTLDVAFTRLLINDEQIGSIELFNEPLVLLIPKNSDYAKQDLISKTDLSLQKFILSEELASPTLFEKSKALFDQLGIEMEVSQFSSNILTNVNLVGMQMGWTIVPAYVEGFIGSNVCIKKTKFPLPNIGL